MGRAVRSGPYDPDVADDQPDDLQDLLSTPEAAAKINVSRRTLARWAREGKVRPAAVYPNGRYRWRLSDLIKALTEMDPDERDD